MVYWERRRTCVKSNEGTWLAARKKNIFLSPDFSFSHKNIQIPDDIIHLQVLLISKYSNSFHYFIKQIFDSIQLF